MMKKHVFCPFLIGRIFILTCFGIAISCLGAMAQSTMITGKVVSETGTPIPSVSVQVKGSDKGTLTAADGSFSINASPGAFLEFSGVGWIPQESKLTGSGALTISLQRDTRSLNEVVVIGYGTTKRKDLTGAVSTISSEQIEKVPVTVLEQSLQGRASGVDVINNDGSPGGGLQVQIRGVGSLGLTDPLYVVDGYPVSGGISNINPDDVASIDVLKDASSTAIYGNRAANGVVIITTKRGRMNGIQISADAQVAIQAKPKEYKVLNAQQFGALAFQHAAIDGYTPLPNWANADTLHEADWQNAVYQSGVRQQYNIALRGGSDKVSTAVSLGYFDQTGIVLGSKYQRFNVSANLDYTPLVWLRSSTSLKFSRANTDIPYATGGQGAGAGVGYLSKLPPTLDGGNMLTNLIQSGPNYGFFNPNNQAVRNWGAGAVYGIQTQDQQNLNNYFLGTTSLEVTLLPGLRIKTNFGVNTNEFSGYYFTPTDTRAFDQYGTGTSTSENFYSQSSNNVFEWLWENTLAYTKTFGANTIDFVGGVSAQSNTFTQIMAQGNNLVSNQLRDLSAVTDVTNLIGNQQTINLYSQFARINYSYLDKYLLTATVRRDGSSRFPPGEQYGVFPSVAVAWRMKEENFLKNSRLFNDLKLRASYGQVGSQINAGNFAYLSQYTSGPPATSTNNNGYPFDHVYQPGLVLSQLPDSSLRWETSDQADIGLDAQFLNGKLTFTTDYYYKKSKDFLLNVPLPPQSGFASGYQNVGSILNQGMEFAITYASGSGDFHWNVGLNLTTLDNKLLSLTNGLTSITNLATLGFSSTGSNNWSTFSKTNVGGPVGEFYGYKTAGIFQNQKEIDQLNAISQAKYGVGNNYETTSGPTKSAVPGDRKFVDVNGDGRITPDDEVALGSPVPKVYGGLTFSGNYKNFDFSIFLYGTYGNKIFNYQERTLESFGSSTGSVGIENIGLTYYQNAWTAANGNERYAQIDANEWNANTRPSDIYVEDGSYLRLRNLTVGYTLPNKIFTGGIPVKIRVFFTGQNLFTITKYTGLNPEIGEPVGTDVNNVTNTSYRSVTASGIDVGTYPTSQFYTLGFNVTF
jgi:TonB-dependent starch-binding outer membrane protein SusC